jgi:hypothetical protein
VGLGRAPLGEGLGAEVRTRARSCEERVEELEHGALGVVTPAQGLLEREVAGEGRAEDRAEGSRRAHGRTSGDRDVRSVLGKGSATSRRSSTASRR